MPFIRNSLTNFEFLSWNVSGIPLEQQENTFAQISIQANPAIIFMQEYDSEFVSHRPPTNIVNYRVFSSNGLSGPSRSNAIALQKALMPMFVLFDSCAIANGLILRLGSFWLICVNLHVPYHGHELMCLEEALDHIEELMDSLLKQTLKRGAKKRNVLAWRW